MGESHENMSKSSFSTKSDFWCKNLRHILGPLLSICDPGAQNSHKGNFFCKLGFMHHLKAE